jgi:hypothetical protein
MQLHTEQEEVLGKLEGHNTKMYQEECEKKIGLFVRGGLSVDNLNASFMPISRGIHIKAGLVSKTDLWNVSFEDDQVKTCMFKYNPGTIIDKDGKFPPGDPLSEAKQKCAEAGWD